MLVLSGEVISEDLTAQKWSLDSSPSLEHWHCSSHGANPGTGREADDEESLKLVVTDLKRHPDSISGRWTFAGPQTMTTISYFCIMETFPTVT